MSKFKEDGLDLGLDFDILPMEDGPATKKKSNGDTSQPAAGSSKAIKKGGEEDGDESEDEITHVPKPMTKHDKLRKECGTMFKGSLSKFLSVSFPSILSNSFHRTYVYPERW